MIADALKKALLQAAIQGKLTEQLPEDGDARDLLKEIQREKARLVKEGKIKKEKPLPEITEDEIPFDIPENWVWVRLGDITFNRGQKKPSEKFTYVDISSINNSKNTLGDLSNILSPKEAPSRARKIVQEGDVIYATVRPYLHNTCLIDRSINPEPIVSTGFAVVTSTNRVINKFLFTCFLSPMFDEYVNSNDNSKGVAYPAINDQKFTRALIPLPPLSEQIRIIKKIEELLPEIEVLQVEENKLAVLEKEFPGKIRASILQAAIQGKLTEQLPEDGDARDILKEIQKEKSRLIREGKLKKEKPLPEITEDEIPFDIPDNWVWVRLGEMALDARSGGTPDTKNSKYYGGKIPFVTIKDMTMAGKYIVDTLTHITELGLANSSAWLVDENHLLYSMYASIGKVSINSVLLATSQAIIALKFIDNEVFRNYIYFYLKSLEAVIYHFAAGTTQMNINAKIVKELLVPLPPLIEQRRIVEKLEELLPLCSSLDQ